MFDIIFRNRFNARYIMLLLLIIILALSLISRCVSTDADTKKVAEEPVVSQHSVFVVARSAVSAAEELQQQAEAEAAAARAEAAEAKFNENPYASFEGALFIGDSRTEGMKLYAGIENAQFFCGKSMTIDKVMNDETANVDGTDINIHDLLQQKQYTKIYICLGINELGWKNLEDFGDKYGELIDMVHAAQPNARLYVELLFPVSAYKSEHDKVVNNTKVEECNRVLIKMANRKKVRTLNPSKVLVDEDGALKSEATADGVHMNSTYCKIWAEYLAKLSR